MRFEKWQALGNDYLIVEHDELPFELTPARIRRLCEGHFGVFADGVLLIAPPKGAEAVASLRIYNPDGSEAELSGNGAREAILYLRRRGWTGEDRFSLETPAGVIRPTIIGADRCRVDMGQASLRSNDFPDGPSDGRAQLSADGQSWQIQHVCIGNPQCAIHMRDEAELDSLDLAAIGPGIEGHVSFPNRTNVSWYAVLGSGPPARIRARIFERGVGETLSSGTGASGAAIAHLLREGPPAAGPVTVVLDGGELEVDVEDDLRVNLTGWARPVFEGRLSEDFIKELHETK